MRLGLHVHTRGKNDLVKRWIDEVRPPVMKWLVDGFDPDLARHARSLGIKVVLRRVADPLRPGAGGSRILERQVLTMADQYRGSFDYVEAANEEMQGRDDPKELDKLAELMLDFMQICDARGHKACVFNFSVGQPEIERWTRPTVRAALDYAYRNGHAIGIHEYYKPVPWQGVDGWTKGGSATAEGWWMLRIVKGIKAMRAAGIKIPDIIVTESGRDDVSGTPGSGKGWRDDSSAPFDEYMAEYCRHLAHHPEVIGVVDFGFASTAGGDPRWHSFDLAANPAMFERAITAMREIPIFAPPVPEPPAPPAPTASPRLIVRSAQGRSSRAGERAKWIVVHSTDTPVGGTPESTAAYLEKNPGQASAHEFVAPGTVYLMVPDGEAAHHAGHATLPDGTSGSAVNRLSWGIEVYQVHGLPCAPALVAIATDRIVEACKRLGITDAERVVGHGEIDPGRRSDPVGVDMDALRAAVAARLDPKPASGEPLVAELRAAAKAEHERAGIRINGASALQRAARADGLIVTTNEFSVGELVALRAEGPSGGAFVYWWDRTTGRTSRAAL